MYKCYLWKAVPMLVDLIVLEPSVLALHPRQNTFLDERATSEDEGTCEQQDNPSDQTE